MLFRSEFVFDFAWEHAYHEHGLAYYPKLVAATPFTPARGPRLLVRRDGDPAAIRTALAEALNVVLEQGRWSSLHVQFATEEDLAALQPAGFMPRIDCQFLWQNRGYRDFDAFLATFSSEKRKKVLRERRRVREAGITHEWRHGSTLSEAEWQSVHGLLAGTFHRHGHEPYLPMDFFAAASREQATEPRVLLARAGGHVVAAALFFQGRDTLYGRYWGSTEAHHSLHFETCYHQGVEYCIREGVQRFEPGTQGEHKIARGFAPTLTRSAHRIADPRFAAAIGRYLTAERASIEDYATQAGSHVPFRRDLVLPAAD